MKTISQPVTEAYAQAQPERGSRAYLYSIVLVAVLGGLLFGYDTAVISGAEKGLQAFFLGATDFVYTDVIHGITSSSALIGCIIGSALSGFCAAYFGRKRSLIIAGIFFFVSALGSYEPEFMLFTHGEPSLSLLYMFNFYRVIGGIGVGLGVGHLPDVYRRGRPEQHTRHTCVVEPVCHHLRPARGLLRQLPDSRRAHTAHHRENR